MRVAAPAKPSPVRSEQIIVFRLCGQFFAVSSASVQEVRSKDGLSGVSTEINAPGLRKVRHVLRRGDKSLFVVNASLHFDLPLSQGTLVFVLRKTRTALLVDGIEKMTAMTKLQALPQSFCHEERSWYRGLTAIDHSVIPVVNPEGFLSPEELALLDAAMPPLEALAVENAEGADLAS
jgi:chemotaxis signal transduction protein